MTKAQRKRETIMDPDQDKYVSSNYNRHAILQDVHPFTEDILQGKFTEDILQGKFTDDILRSK